MFKVLGVWLVPGLGQGWFEAGQCYCPNHFSRFIGVSCMQVTLTGVYKVEYFPPPGGNNIKGLGEGGKKSNLKKRKKRRFLKI